MIFFGLSPMGNPAMIPMEDTPKTTVSPIGDHCEWFSLDPKIKRDRYVSYLEHCNTYIRLKAEKSSR